MLVLLAGGGSGGPTTPLLAIADEIKRRDQSAAFVFIGTKKGPEKEIVQKKNILFQSIACGKIRRYFSLKNILAPFQVFIAFVQSFFIILKNKPDFIIGAGSFVQVPVIYAGYILRIPIFIHQQDIFPTLSNKLCAPLARQISLAVEESKKNFLNQNTVVAGNPVQPIILQGSKSRAIQKFGLDQNLPVLFITTGGTGALAINKIVFEAVDELAEFCQIIHQVGKGKGSDLIKNKNYFQAEFLTGQDMADAYAAADLVVSRAGFSAISEIASLAKPAMIIPMPNTHQEFNANYFADRKACAYLDQKGLSVDKFVQAIKNIISDLSFQNELSRNISLILKPNAEKLIVDSILEEIK